MRKAFEIAVAAGSLVIAAFCVAMAILGCALAMGYALAAMVHTFLLAPAAY